MSFIKLDCNMIEIWNCDSILSKSPAIFANKHIYSYRSSYFLSASGFRTRFVPRCINSARIYDRDPVIISLFFVVQMLWIGIGIRMIHESSWIRKPNVGSGNFSSDRRSCTECPHLHSLFRIRRCARRSVGRNRTVWSVAGGALQTPARIISQRLFVLF